MDNLENTAGQLVYLVHLDRPLSHMHHYCGTTSNLARRMANHRMGTGSKFLAQAVKAEISFRVVRVWLGANHDVEKHIKMRRMALLCPICLASGAKHNSL